MHKQRGNLGLLYWYFCQSFLSRCGMWISTVFWNMQDGGSMIISCIGTIFRKLEKEIPSDLMKISMTNGYILFYLYDNKDKDVYQKDFEENFGITRSTASKILSLMETKELVRRESVAGDARLKKITLTENGEELRRKMIAIKDKMEEQLKEGFSEKEIQQLYGYLERIKDNLMR